MDGRRCECRLAQRLGVLCTRLFETDRSGGAGPMPRQAGLRARTADAQEDGACEASIPTRCLGSNGAICS